MSYRNILVLGHPDSGKTTLLLAFASKNGTQSPTVLPSEQFISERIRPLVEESNEPAPTEIAATKTEPIEEKKEQEAKEIVDQVEKVELSENKPANQESTEQRIEEPIEDEANQETTEATEQKVEKAEPNEDKPVEVAPAQQTPESQKTEPKEDKPVEQIGEESKKVEESKGLNRKSTLKKTNTRISIKLDVEGLINNPENINFWYKTFGSDSRIIKSYVSPSEAQDNSSRIDLLLWDVESLKNMPEDGGFSDAPFTFFDLDAVVLVYDVGSPETFQKIPELKKELKKFSAKPAIFLIGFYIFFFLKS
jgi:GTPase SAR1 family protein